ncbi:G-protein coupled receptor 4-like [Melanotaenia boesemani]|uniref:G-protein coupled receptor 4-like n=1 Tax=Melanotaenia boesemani TaxID=1250792 RepID=UPI001C05A3AD|nr:G-protein coupled receptor 4-like [Melanotaenia boesemani]
MNTSTNISISIDDENITDSSYAGSVMNVVEWIIICFGLPLTLVTIAAVYSLIRKDHVAPVYIINLLVSDLIQLCCLTASKANVDGLLILCFYFFSLMLSVGFMVCISLERYLTIAWPLWYRFRRNINTSVVVCVVVWILPLVYVLPFYFSVNVKVTETILAVYLLLPFPLFLFFLVGTIKALSAAHSVPADEKRRIVAILVVLLLIYMLLFLPNIIWLLSEEARNNEIYFKSSFILLHFSPLADLSMYIFIRKGATDKLLKSLCCKMSTSQQMSSMSNDTMSASCTQTL